MRSQIISATALVAAAVVQGKTCTKFRYEFVRLNKTDAALLVVDHQIGLSALVRDYEPAAYRQNIIAHAALGNLFNLPTILTTSAESGPNGRLPKEITDLHPTAPFIKRNGEVNAWDNPEFKAAVKATGKKQIILAGIVTEVCTAFLALSLRAEGYEVFANTDASGTFNDKLAADANRRMEAAGVHLMGMFGIAMDLMRDWRNTPGSAEVLPFMDKYLVPYSLVARAHGDAIDNGTIIPGEAQILTV
ncbi:Isochorismatase-like hydrolase [Glarea lozoyensis ATCC 20868]|uniref:Isochorismatase-like hydrolase n=2 Tax=Glarea lozoyensis TaxID=101852 RepID=S3DLN1_GLAL2|nr:Isochorismatase-like hydrolase [Glarea lozoyensis ATCC 20868]EHL01854.1 hypothetical protein M7I_2211 [Glarea lozoyensis 74030]EPE27448.1 Isochorismatase-like hydrolase [Glarea lozoyensis ATCC 20868]